MAEAALAIAHFSPVGNPAPAAPPQARPRHDVDHVVRRRRRDAPLERAVAVARDVLVDVERIDLAAVLEHDAVLLGEVGCRGAGAAIDRVGVLFVARVPEATRAVPVEPARGRARSNVAASDLARHRRGHVRVESGAGVALDDFHHGLQVAHAVAAHPFHDRAGRRPPRLVEECGIDRFAAARDAARAKADADLDGLAVHAGSFSRARSSATTAVAGVSRPAV